MAYLKPQSPIIYTEDHVYPLTTADQVILANGKRLEQNGVVVAEKLGSPKAISLAGDVTGTVNFDGSNNVRYKLLCLRQSIILRYYLLLIGVRQRLILKLLLFLVLNLLTIQL